MPQVDSLMPQVDSLGKHFVNLVRQEEGFIYRFDIL